MSGNNPEHQLVIAATPRCGSTFLGRALAATKLVGTPEEWFQNSNMEECRRRYGLPADLPNHKLRNDIIANETNENGWFSIKIMRDTFECILQFMRQFPDYKGKPGFTLLQTLFPNASYLLMRREDKLKQAISYVKAAQTGIWEYRGGKKSYDNNLLQFDYLAIEAAQRKLSANEKKWLNLFSANNIAPLLVTYEELVKNYEATILEILGFAGFADTDIPDIRNNEMRRMSDKTNSLWLSQHQEIRNSLGDDENVAPPTPQRDRRARISIDAPNSYIVAGQRFELRATVGNCSKSAWRTAGTHDGRNWTVVRGRWLDSDRKPLRWDESRGYLPLIHRPREKSEAGMIATAPEQPGEYFFELHCALEDRGGLELFPKRPAAIKITVELSRVERECRLYFGPNMLSQLGEWKWSPWLGYFFAGDFPWICHDQLGWMLCSGLGVSADEFLLSQDQLGWLKTSSQDFPRLWSKDRNQYLEYLPPSTKPCRFRVADSDEIIEINPLFD